MASRYRRRPTRPLRGSRRALRTTLPMALRGRASTTRTSRGRLNGANSARPAPTPLRDRGRRRRRPPRSRPIRLTAPRRPPPPHTGVTAQHRLHLGGIDVLPTRDDELGPPPADADVAVRRPTDARSPVANQPSASVAGVRPTPVAPEQGRARTSSSPTPVRVRLVDGGLHAGQRDPDRTGPALAVEGVGQREQGLAHAVALEHRHALARPGACHSSAGSGADPETQRRSADSSAARPVAARRWYMVGTPKNSVLPRRRRAPRPRRSARRGRPTRRRPGCRTGPRTARARGRAGGTG